MTVKFSPVKEFKDGGNHYLVGMSYTVREGNAALAEKVKDWTARKMVTTKVQTKGTGQASISGKARSGKAETKKERS